MRKFLLVGAGIAAMALSLSAARTANASVQFKLVSGATTTIVTDNGVGDSNPVVGQIAFAGSVGAFSTVITSAVSNSPGLPAGSYLQSNHISIRDTSTGQATLTISVTDTNFALPTGNLLLGSSFAGTFLSGAAGESVSYQSYADTSNTAFGTAITPGLQSATLPSGSPLPFSFNTPDRSVGFVSSSLFSMTGIAVINLSAGGQANLAGTTTVVPVGGTPTPEPGCLAILGLGGAGLMMARRRRV